ncbi:MAG: InlB B-repeat-containing protein, partial [Solirubrobacterales bacterium]
MAILGAALFVGVPSASATTWNLPATDLSATGQNAYDPQVAIAPDGAITVVWRRFNGTNSIIQAATRPAGSGTFGAPENLSVADHATADAFVPQVAIAPDGATTVVWYRDNGTHFIIQAATRPAGSGTFGAPQDLSETLQNAVNPQVAIAPDGATTVVWARATDPKPIIQAATRPAGSGTFGAPQNLSVAGQNALNPQVAIAPDGATTVVWSRTNGTHNIIQAASSEPTPYQLSVTKSGEGTVTSTPAGITCGASCQAPFNPGTPVTLTATAAAGSTFTGWSGSGCSGTGTCSVTMSGARSVTATFAIARLLT